MKRIVNAWVLAMLLLGVAGVSEAKKKVPTEKTDGSLSDDLFQGCNT